MRSVLRNLRSYTSSSSTSTSAMATNLPPYLNQDRAVLQSKFKDLEWNQADRLRHEPGDAAADPRWARPAGAEIARRNRYSNIDPFERNRVRLLATGEDESDYINASSIAMRCVRSGTEHRYIATQGPKQSSLAHFYMMLWESVQDPAVIVMLTQTWEAGREKCFEYYPSSDPEAGIPHHPFQVNSGDFTATIELIDITFDATSRSHIRQIRMTVGDRQKTIWHYLFEGWPDFGVPEGEDRVALINLIRQTSVRANNTSPSVNPRIVHCSAGVGRTGTFIALDYLLNELEEGSLITADPNVDRIADCVDELRQQRMYMVQAEPQFHFLYETVKEQWLARRSTTMS